NVGPLRAQIIKHCAPLVQDVVVSGANRGEIGILIFANIEACRRAARLPPGAAANDVFEHDQIRSAIQSALGSLAKQSTGSSNRVCRAMLLKEPPSLDIGEITDKGSINQRVVLSHRAALVEELHADPPSARVIVID